MTEEPVCIHRAGTIEEADIIVAWLADRGVKASILDPENPGGLAFGVTDPEGYEIYVTDASTAQQALKLLEEHDRERERGTLDSDLPEQITTTCEECGQSNSFSADLAGTVQQCEQCGAHIDVQAIDPQ